MGVVLHRKPWIYFCFPSVQNKFPSRMIKDLQRVVEQDPLAQLDEQDKELIWQMRYTCVE